MSFSKSLTRLKRQISRPGSPTRRNLQRMAPKVSQIAALTLPVMALGNSAMAQSAALVTSKAPAEAVVTWQQSIILGLVQGLTEFIPVSSSAHLNIVHGLMGHGRELSYDVVLSIGTILALAWYYRHDWKALLTDPKQRKLLLLVLLSCVPAVIFAKIINKYEDKPPLSLPSFNALMLVVAGFLLWFVDRTSKRTRKLESAEVKDSLLVGIAQAMALIPGVSRSGATLTMGRLLGFERPDAARFSFLMSLPISIGAVVFKYKDFSHINAPVSALVLGTLFSAISGFWAISFLLNYLKTRDFTPFFIWRAVVALVVFGLSYVHILK